MFSSPFGSKTLKLLIDPVELFIVKPDYVFDLDDDRGKFHQVFFILHAFKSCQLYHLSLYIYILYILTFS